MATARREQRRALSLDVWRLFVDKRFDAEDYLRTGEIEVMQRHPLPDNPLIHEAIEKIERERLEHVKGNGRSK